MKKVIKKGHTLKNENLINIVIHNDKKNKKRKRRTQTTTKQKYSTLGNIPQGGQAPVYFTPQNELNRLAHNYVQEDTRFALPVTPKRDVDNLHDVVYQALEDAKPTVQRMIKDSIPNTTQKTKKKYNVLKTNSQLDKVSKNDMINKLKSLGVYKTKYNTKSKLAQALGDYMKSNSNPIVNEPHTPSPVISEIQENTPELQPHTSELPQKTIRVKSKRFTFQSPVNQPDFNEGESTP